MVRVEKNITTGDKAANIFTNKANYLMNEKAGNEGERVLWAECRNIPVSEGRTTDKEAIRNAAIFMEHTAKNNYRIKNPPSLHYSVSFHPYDRKVLTDEVFDDIVERMIESLGMQEYQTIIVRHGDTKHPHFHLLFNRIHPVDLHAKNEGMDMCHLFKLSRDLEEEYGLVKARIRFSWRDKRNIIYNIKEFARKEFANQVHKDVFEEMGETIVTDYNITKSLAKYDYFIESRNEHWIICIRDENENIPKWCYISDFPEQRVRESLRAYLPFNRGDKDVVSQSYCETMYQRSTREYDEMVAIEKANHEQKRHKYIVDVGNKVTKQGVLFVSENLKSGVVKNSRFILISPKLAEAIVSELKKDDYIKIITNSIKILFHNKDLGQVTGKTRDEIAKGYDLLSVNFQYRDEDTQREIFNKIKFLEDKRCILCGNVSFGDNGELVIRKHDIQKDKVPRKSKEGIEM